MAIDARIGLAIADLARFNDMLEQRHDLGHGLSFLRAARHAGSLARLHVVGDAGDPERRLAAAQRLDHLRPNVAA
jgi:hypothetical protein